MTLYLTQQRRLHKASDGPGPSFPAPVNARIWFAPEDAFGIYADRPRTTLRQHSEPTLWWDANEGVMGAEGGLISELAGTVTGDGISANIKGNIVSIAYHASNMETAYIVAASASQSLPAILSLRLRTFVWITRSMVQIDGIDFGLELPRVMHPFIVANSENNSERAEQSIRDWLALEEQHYRLFSVLNYLRHANQLRTVFPIPETMVAEVLLNLTKALEMLFGTANRDQLRETARRWSVSAQLVDECIIPLFLLRNEMDVAHVASAPLSYNERQTIAHFMEKSVGEVTEIVSSIAERVLSGDLTLTSPKKVMDRDKAKLLEKISDYLE